MAGRIGGPPPSIPPSEPSRPKEQDISHQLKKDLNIFIELIRRVMGNKHTADNEKVLTDFASAVIALDLSSATATTLED